MNLRKAIDVEAKALDPKGLFSFVTLEHRPI